MILDLRKYKPIKISGYIFIGFSLFALVFLRADLKEPGFREFLIIMSAWHFLIGLGLILRKMWGYHLFKSYLYLSYPGFPIGTTIAYFGLKYLKENDIKAFFNKHSLEI
jgi:hypothetical protein